MLVYAGIDEAGYGPAYGPLTVGCCVLTIPRADADAPPPDLWARLSRGVARTLRGRDGRVVLADSKKLTTPAAGVAHLEAGCLALTALADARTPAGTVPADVGELLDAWGETDHRRLARLPWYARDPADRPVPWASLPTAAAHAADPGPLAVARGRFVQAARRIGVRAEHLAVRVVFEDRFNAAVDATGSRAAVNLAAIAEHLRTVRARFGVHGPRVVVDRQSGRSRYGAFLRDTFPGVAVRAVHESPAASVYRVGGGAGQGAGEGGGGERPMEVAFPVAAEADHLPVAAASMLAKYTRELLMARFKAWFAARAPEVRPTAGYGTDAARFTREIAPHLTRLGLNDRDLRRRPGGGFASGTARETPGDNRPHPAR